MHSRFISMLIIMFIPKKQDDKYPAYTTVTIHQPKHIIK
jgi:hypothetical protein